MSLTPGSRTPHHGLVAAKLWILCFVAVSPSLGTAVAAIGRLALYLLALGCLLYAATRRSDGAKADATHPLTIMILLSTAYMALTVLWSSVSLDEALIAWTRHARLLTIPVVCYLIASAAEGTTVLRAFVGAQVFVVLSAWLLVFGIHMPWATAKFADDTYAVFGSYLEQSITQSVLAAILWFQRDTIFGWRGRWIAIALAAATLLLTLGFLQGRSGHMVALGLVSLACMHAIPRRFKWMAVGIPFLAFALVMAGSQNFRHRMMQVVSEVSAYSKTQATDSSSGERLVYWGTSVKAIVEAPLLGHGSGSWNHEFRKQGGDKVAPATTDNPHQMFLLWGVEGGLMGVASLIAVLGALLAISRKLAAPDALTLQALVLALVISGMFNSMIFGIGIGDFFCIGFGILLSFVNRPQPPYQPSSHAENP